VNTFKGLALASARYYRCQVPRNLARIEDLGRGDLVQVDCGAATLLTPELCIGSG
jgi:hypothetical protein